MGQRDGIVADPGLIPSIPYGLLSPPEVTLESRSGVSPEFGWEWLQSKRKEILPRKTQISLLKEIEERHSGILFFFWGQTWPYPVSGFSPCDIWETICLLEVEPWLATCWQAPYLLYYLSSSSRHGEHLADFTLHRKVIGRPIAQ